MRDDIIVMKENHSMNDECWMLRRELHSHPIQFLAVEIIDDRLVRCEDLPVN